MVGRCAGKDVGNAACGPVLNLQSYRMGSVRKYGYVGANPQGLICVWDSSGMFPQPKFSRGSPMPWGSSGMRAHVRGTLLLAYCAPWSCVSLNLSHFGVPLGAPRCLGRSLHPSVPSPAPSLHINVDCPLSLCCTCCADHPRCLPWGFEA
jgi:hypothetical protein